MTFVDKIKKYKKPIMVLCYIAVAVFLVIYLVNYWDDFSILFQVPATSFVGLLLVSQFTQFPAFYPRKLMFKRLGHDLPFRDWFGFNAFSNFLAKIVPLRADLAISAVYYKRENNLDISKFGSALYGNVIISIIVLMIELAISLFIIGFSDNNWPALLWVILFIGVAAFFIIIKVTDVICKKMNSPKKFFVYIKELLVGFTNLAKDRKLLFTLVMLTVCSALGFVLRMYLSYAMMGAQVGFAQIMVYSSLMQISDIFAILPGNLGVRELISGIAASIIGTGFQEGFAAAILMRLSAFIIHGLNGGIWWIYNAWRKKKLRESEAESEIVPDKTGDMK